MAKETKKTATTENVGVAPDVSALQKRIESLTAENAQLTKKVEDLEAARKEANSDVLPRNVIIFPDGKIVPIERTVLAKFALDEVKKGKIRQDIELIVPKQ